MDFGKLSLGILLGVVVLAWGLNAARGENKELDPATSVVLLCVFCYVPGLAGLLGLLSLLGFGRRKGQLSKGRGAFGYVAGTLIALSMPLALMTGLSPHPPAHGSVTAATWQLVEPPGGRFQVQMPGTPTEEVSPGDGQIETRKKYAFNDTVTGNAFLAAILDVSAAAINPQTLALVYRGELERMRTVTKGKLAQEIDVLRDGYKGKEFALATAGGGYCIEQVFVVPGAARALILILAAVGPGIQSGQGDAARFFDSLRILKEGPPIWITVEPPGENCRFEMPGKPTEQSPAADGKRILRRKIYSFPEKSADRSFVVAILDVSAQASKELSLEALYQSEVKRIVTDKVKLTKEGPIERDGYQGKEFQASAEDVCYIEQIFWVPGDRQGRFFLVVTAGRSIQPGTGDAAKFFGAFHILDGAKR
jgi:hypothetical protein